MSILGLNGLKISRNYPSSLLSTDKVQTEKESSVALFLLPYPPLIKSLLRGCTSHDMRDVAKEKTNRLFY